MLRGEEHAAHPLGINGVDEDVSLDANVVE